MVTAYNPPIYSLHDSNNYPLIDSNTDSNNVDSNTTYSYNDSNNFISLFPAGYEEVISSITTLTIYPTDLNKDINLKFSGNFLSFDSIRVYFVMVD